MRMPDFIDLEFSSRCNLACGYCFGPVDDRSVPDLPKKFWHQILDELRRRGVLGVVISGGEPTMYPHITELLEHAKALGLQVIVSTHGRHSSLVMNCAQYADWLALPVDGLSKFTIKNLRGDEWGIREAEDLSRSLKSFRPHLKLKLGSVATKKNLSEILRLADYLSENATSFDTWKIYEYTARRKFVESKSSFALDADEFNGLASAINSKAIARKIRVVLSSIESRRLAYLFVYPDGRLAVPNVGEYLTDQIFGNLYTEGMSVFDRALNWEYPNNAANFLSTYSL